MGKKKKTINISPVKSLKEAEGKAVSKATLDAIYGRNIPGYSGGRID